MAFVLKKIALDSSVLLQKKGVLEKIRNEWGNGVELAVPTQVNQELKSLERKNRRFFKKIAVLWEEQKNFGVKEKKVHAKNADDALIELAQKGFAIISLDQKLKKKVLEKKGLLIEIRGKNFFKTMEA